MKPRFQTASALLALALLACEPERNPLEYELGACRAATEEREAAAQFCEALYEAERDRVHHLVALADASLPTGMGEPFFIDTQRAGTLPPPAQAEIAIQLDRYRAVMGGEVNSLVEEKQALQAEIGRLQAELARAKTSRQTEVARLHESYRERLSLLDAKTGSEAQALAIELRREKSERARLEDSLSRISSGTRATISSLNDFDRTQASSWKRRHRSTILGFHSSLETELLEILAAAERR